MPCMNWDPNRGIAPKQTELKSENFLLQGSKSLLECKGLVLKSTLSILERIQQKFAGKTSPREWVKIEVIDKATGKVQEAYFNALQFVKDNTQALNKQGQSNAPEAADVFAQAPHTSEEFARKCEGNSKEGLHQAIIDVLRQSQEIKTRVPQLEKNHQERLDLISAQIEIGMAGETLKELPPAKKQTVLANEPQQDWLLNGYVAPNPPISIASSSSSPVPVNDAAAQKELREVPTALVQSKPARQVTNNGDMPHGFIMMTDAENPDRQYKVALRGPIEADPDVVVTQLKHHETALPLLVSYSDVKGAPNVKPAITAEVYNRTDGKQNITSQDRKKWQEALQHKWKAGQRAQAEAKAKKEAAEALAKKQVADAEAAVKQAALDEVAKKLAAETAARLADSTQPVDKNGNNGLVIKDYFQ